MKRVKKELSDTEIRAHKTPEKSVKLSDGANTPGLYLEVTPSGSKLWRLKFRLDGKERRLALGVYPEVGLRDARAKAEGAKRMIKQGVDPVEVGRAAVAAEKAVAAVQAARVVNTFERVAAMFMEHKRSLTDDERLTDATLDSYESRLRKHANPHIGAIPVAELKYSQVKVLVNTLKAKSKVTAIHTLGLIKRVLDFAEGEGLVERNVAANRSDLRPKHKAKEHPAILDPIKLGELLRKLDAHHGAHDSVGAALRLLVMLAVRPVEITLMRWDQLDMAVAVAVARWEFTVSKTGKGHIVPLPVQALAILEERRVQAKVSDWVFPSKYGKNKPITVDSLLSRLINGLGYTRGEITAHGFRSQFRTLGHEVLDLDPLVLEMCLSHTQPLASGLGAAYARAQLLKGRTAAMQAWANYLDKLRAGTDPQ